MSGRLYINLIVKPKYGIYIWIILNTLIVIGACEFIALQHSLSSVVAMLIALLILMSIAVVSYIDRVCVTLPEYRDIVCKRYGMEIASEYSERIRRCELVIGLFGVIGYAIAIACMLVLLICTTWD